MKNFLEFFLKGDCKNNKGGLVENEKFFWKIFLKGHEEKTGEWPLEKCEIFLENLYGEPWALSNTPFYGGG